MRPFDALLFDLGSTLIYFEGEWPIVLEHSARALYRSLVQSGLKLESESFLSTFLERLRQYYTERDTEFIEYTTAYVLRNVLSQHGQPNVPEPVLAAALREMYAVSQAQWQTEAECKQTLASLKEQGYKLGLLSNAADDADVQTLVDKAGIREYLDAILTSAAAGIRKPNPKIFHMLLQQMDVSPQRTAMVGDTLGADILGAHNAGLYSIWITRRADTAGNRAHAGTIQPNAVITSLDELPPLLQRLGEQR